MCLAIFKKGEATLSKESLKIAFANNSDGAGFAYSKDGNLYIKKGFFTFEDFWQEFCEIQEGNPCLVHFRIGTSGEKGLDNCHPFAISDNTCFIHNVILSDFKYKDCKESDTNIFGQMILSDLIKCSGDSIIFNSSILWMLRKTIGDGNKMAFLNKNGEYQIVFEEKGIWENNCWFSNDSFRKLKNTSNNNSSNNSTNTNLHMRKRHYVVYSRCSGNKRKSLYVNTLGGRGSCLYGYRLTKNDPLLTIEQIEDNVLPLHKKKLKELVKMGIVERVELNSDHSIKGEENNNSKPSDQNQQLQLWLMERSSLNAKHEILSGSIQS